MFSTPAKTRREIRQARAAPIADAFFAWCRQENSRVLDESPMAQAIGYARNQQVALRRFLDDGRLPLHNNISELNLRRQVVGRKNWLFVGSDDGAEVNAAFVSLLASCSLHKIEPLGYMRDLLCLLPRWPRHRVLELAPANSGKTLEQRRLRRPSTPTSFVVSSSGCRPVPRIALQSYSIHPQPSATRETGRIRLMRAPTVATQSGASPAMVTSPECRTPEIFSELGVASTSGTPIRHAKGLSGLSLQKRLDQTMR